MVKLPRNFAAFIALLLAIVSWGLAAWTISGMMATQRLTSMIERERTEARHNAEVMAANLRVNFAHIRTIPIILATKESVITRLAEFGPHVAPSPLPRAERNRLWRSDPGLADLARQLNHLVKKSDIVADGIWIMNAAGDTIAIASPSGGVDYTGENYRERYYFKIAKSGKDGQQFAIGKLGGLPGFFFSSPVYYNDEFVGVVASRINLSDLSEKLSQNMFLTDDSGVIVYASDPQLRMKTMPGTRVAQISPADRLSRYRQETFEPLSLKPAPDFGGEGIYRRPGSALPWILAQHGGDLTTVYVLKELRDIEGIRRDRITAFLLQTVAGTALILFAAGCGLYVLKGRDHARELARQASTDALTGCANRRFFLARLEAEREQCLRDGEDFCVLVLDLDHFKQVNDRYGHHGGDHALCRFVEVTRSILRADDLLGRMGGEEFAILLSKMSPDDAIQVAERIRLTVAEAVIKIKAEEFTIRISLGGALWQRATAESCDDILIRADKALYLAKETGRNQVCFV